MAANLPDTPLDAKRIAVLMTDGFEQVEFTGPRDFLQEHGAVITIVSPKAKGKQVVGMHHKDVGDSFDIDLTVAEAQARDYDALLLPGGVANPDELRIDPVSVAFVKEFADAGKPIAAICHGPWTLIDAEAVKGKQMTSWPSLQADLRNAGAVWRDEKVVVDGNLVTSRKPDDIPAFNEAFLTVLTQARAARTS
ncbi:type 1 glutamine amidotransferase domain-containing protein [Janthinobacterium sp. PSPC3-1]|uniref:type 1 glutamine amidotransferase domain-containing protein n=1 Tax=Janthinobacterium sp. PSPC3-1 TaxID=2804653 RepID=UPI003CF73EAF